MLQRFAASLEHVSMPAAITLREGAPDLFTMKRIGVPAPLQRFLNRMNVLDSRRSGLHQRMQRVRRWRSGMMALRWAAASLCAAVKSFRGIPAHKHLGALKSILDGVAADLPRAPDTMPDEPQPPPA